MFLSLKKHMEASPDRTSALMQLSQTLLRAIRLHVVRGEEREVHRFQSAVLEIEERVGPGAGTAELLVAAGAASRAHEEYCHHTNRYLQVQSGELATMIAMLTSTVSSISTASQTAVEQLGRVEKRIENLTYATDLPRLKAELADCLAMVREESFRQREMTSSTIHTLQRGVSDSRSRLADASSASDARVKPAHMRDKLTDLPARADAEDALYQARQRKNMYVAVLPVDRLALINSRFGSDSMDQAVKFFAAHLQRHLAPTDLLFRWSEHAFLALVERAQAPDTVRADLSKFASAKLELVLEHHGREILLPVSSTWVLLPVGEGRSYEAMTTKIDAFIRNEMHLKDSF